MIEDTLGRINPNTYHRTPNFKEIHSIGEGALSVGIRKAKDIIRYSLPAGAIVSRFHDAFAPRVVPDNYLRFCCDIDDRAAWAIVSMWLITTIAIPTDGVRTVSEGERLFYGSLWTSDVSLTALLPAGAVERAHEELAVIPMESLASRLLPYILDPYGPGSRASVLKNPRTEETRAQRKRIGSYNTPVDVADYIVTKTYESLGDGGDACRVLDPACGTGVFLVAALRNRQRFSDSEAFNAFEFITEKLYGVDVNPLAVESCTFCLLAEALAANKDVSLSLWGAWHAIRLNLAVGDSLLINTRSSDKVAKECLCAAEVRQEAKRTLKNASGFIKPIVVSTYNHLAAAELTDSEGAGSALRSVFPEVYQGFEIIVCNPPYTRVKDIDNGVSAYRDYQSFKGLSVTGSEYLFLLFLEMSWRLTRQKRGAAGMVVPLSVAYHGGRAFMNFRRAIGASGLQWRFSFFDREPHALFGENVKLRNAIVLSARAVERTRLPETKIETASMMRWTSQSRANLFQQLEYTEVDGQDIARLIPKIGSDIEATAYKALRASSDSIMSLINRAEKLRLEDVLASRKPVVVVGNTAYNYLNVFFGHEVVRPAGLSLTSSPLTCLLADEPRELYCIYAILNSRLLYWLWWAEGDGFHVTQRFIRGAPFGRRTLSNSDIRGLAELGRCLWKQVQQLSFVSLNGGKATITFNPLRRDNTRAEIDNVLIQAGRLPAALMDKLTSLVRRNVIVDDTSDTRVNSLDEG